MKLNLSKLRIDQWGLIVSVSLIALGMLLTFLGNAANELMESMERSKRKEWESSEVAKLNSELDAMSDQDYKNKIKDVLFNGKRAFVNGVGSEFEYSYILGDGKTYWVSFMAQDGNLPKEASFLCGAKVGYKIYISSDGGDNGSAISKNVEKRNVSIDCPGGNQSSMGENTADDEALPRSYFGTWDVDFQCDNSSYKMKLLFSQNGFVGNNDSGNLGGLIENFSENGENLSINSNGITMFVNYKNDIRLTSIGLPSAKEGFSKKIKFDAPIKDGDINRISGIVTDTSMSGHECGTWTATRVG